jgi:hypothetical protein
MFQPWFLELLQVIADSTVTVTAIVVAVVAICGLSQWRRELRGKARFDVVKRFAYSAYEFRDRYKIARSMWTDASESASRVPHSDETKDEAFHRNEHYARSRRLQPLQENLRSMYQANWEGQIIFADQHLEGLIRPFEEAFKELYLAVGMYFSRYIERAMKGTTPAKDDEAWLEADRKLIYGYPDDEKNKAIDAIVADFIVRIRALAD